MTLINTEIINRIKRENDIVSMANRLGLFDRVSSRQIGRKNIQIKCIFHEEKTASLTLYTKTGTFYCFGCGANGDVISLIQKRLNLNFQQALKWLDPTLEISPQINFDEAKKYLIDHGISYESQQKFDFCFTKIWIGDNQYPTIKFNTPGGYKHRVFGLDGTKYRFEKGAKYSLFKTGGNPKIAVITEGEFDSIRVWQETGYSCFSPTVGNMGFKMEFIKELSNFDLIVVGFDNDDEGKKGSQKTIETLKQQINLNKIVQIEVPKSFGKDWCDYFSAGMFKNDFDELIKINTNKEVKE